MASADWSRPMSRSPWLPPYRRIWSAWMDRTSSRVRKSGSAQLLGEALEDAGVARVDLFEGRGQLLRPLLRAHGRDDDDVSVGGDLDGRVRVDAGGLEQRPVQHQRQAVPGPRQSLAHGTYILP